MRPARRSRGGLDPDPMPGGVRGGEEVPPGPGGHHAGVFGHDGPVRHLHPEATLEAEHLGEDVVAELRGRHQNAGPGTPRDTAVNDHCGVVDELGLVEAHEGAFGRETGPVRRRGVHACRSPARAVDLQVGAEQTHLPRRRGLEDHAAQALDRLRRAGGVDERRDPVQVGQRPVEDVLGVAHGEPDGDVRLARHLVPGREVGEREEREQGDDTGKGGAEAGEDPVALRRAEGGPVAARPLAVRGRAHACGSITSPPATGCARPTCRGQAASAVLYSGVRFAGIPSLLLPKASARAPREVGGPVAWASTGRTGAFPPGDRSEYRLPARRPRLARCPFRVAAPPGAPPGTRPFRRARPR